MLAVITALHSSALLVGCPCLPARFVAGAVADDDDVSAFDGDDDHREDEETKEGALVAPPAVKLGGWATRTEKTKKPTRAAGEVGGPHSRGGAPGARPTEEADIGLVLEEISDSPRAKPKARRPTNDAPSVGGILRGVDATI